MAETLKARDVFRRARETSGLSVRKLASEVGITHSMLSRFETGTVESGLTMDVLAKMEDVINSQPREQWRVVSLTQLSSLANPELFQIWAQQDKKLLELVAEEMMLEAERTKKKAADGDIERLGKDIAALKEKAARLERVEAENQRLLKRIAELEKQLRVKTSRSR